VCAACGGDFDADVNAARNIIVIGTSPTGGLPGWPVNRAGLPAGSRKKTLARAEARPFRAESSHKPNNGDGIIALGALIGLELRRSSGRLHITAGPQDLPWNGPVVHYLAGVS
jgi:hypothetical protein